MNIEDIIRLSGVKIKIDKNMRKRGGYNSGKVIHIRDENDFMAILHEIGHMLCGCSCCREHEEFMAHGFSVGVAKLIGIPENEIKQMDEAMDVYAGRSVCLRIGNKGL